MQTINRSFTWYEVRSTSSGGTLCKGTHYQFTEDKALQFLTELKNDPKTHGEDFQVVRVRTSEKTVYPK